MKKLVMAVLTGILIICLLAGCSSRGRNEPETAGGVQSTSGHGQTTLLD